MIQNFNAKDTLAMQTASSFSRNRRRLEDIIAASVVRVGGIGIIICIIAILFFIGMEALPLWQGVKSELENTFFLRESPAFSSYSLSEETGREQFPFVALGADEYRGIGLIFTKDAKAYFISLQDGEILQEYQITDIEDQKITSAFVAENNKLFVFGTNRGYVQPVFVNYKIEFDKNDKRTVIPSLKIEDPILFSDNPIMHLAYDVSEDGDGKAAAAFTSFGELKFKSFYLIEDDFSDMGSWGSSEFNLTSDLNGEKATAMELDKELLNLYVGTDKGNLYNWKLRGEDRPELVDIIQATDKAGSAITALAFLLGDRSLVVGDQDGNVSVWFDIQDKTSPTGYKLTKVHVLPPLELPITRISSSPRDRGLLVSDTGGNINLYNVTSNQKLAEYKTRNSPIYNLSFTPKADGILAIDKAGYLYDWKVDNPHPETNLKTLFGKVWYEGYSKPEYVWQSTGGTDEFEPKLSLTPLAFGTIKGAFYAMLFSIPLGILSAICVSQFMHPSVRNIIKPVLEIMAALPSVVLGFFAGLWLAPHIVNVIPAIFIMPIVITSMTIFSVILWKYLPGSIRGRFKEGTELFLLLIVVIIGVMISLGLNTYIENIFLDGSYKNWLFNVLGLQYDQRNSLIVGFAMGFAVIPIIFTLSEDALSSVPKHLTAGSFALGANKWETAIRVVLPTASPAIFSAVMIGLGRAIGETMIVLMATGNTPIMDWNIFNGFRALSANIAVEIPEAPHGGTLYRVLFLAAILLFFFTFILNTIAEVVRQRLRKKYGQL